MPDVGGWGMGVGIGINVIIAIIIESRHNDIMLTMRNSHRWASGGKVGDAIPPTKVFSPCVDMGSLGVYV